MQGLISFVKNEFGKPSNLHKSNKGISGKMSIDIGIVSHCNLNCRGCNHFSPIIDKEFITLEEYLNDLKRLSELLENEIYQINLLGGEPLLHPQIDKFIEVTHCCFPSKRITIITNGLLLSRQSEEFWEQCRKANIIIEITRYPIKFKYNELIKLGKRQGVRVVFYGRSRYVEKTLFKLPLDMEGTQNPILSFENCYMGGLCITLYHGKLFPCSYAAYVEWYNKKFGQNLKICLDDYVDIYQESDALKAKKKLQSAIPFCRYCATKANVYGEKWGTSKREMKEWCI